MGPAKVSCERRETLADKETVHRLDALPHIEGGIAILPAWQRGLVMAAIEIGLEQQAGEAVEFGAIAGDTLFDKPHVVIRRQGESVMHGDHKITPCRNIRPRPKLHSSLPFS